MAIAGDERSPAQVLAPRLLRDRIMRRHFILVALAVGSMVSGCELASDEDGDDDPEVATSDLTARQTLLTQGFVYKRRERFEYDLTGPATASGLVCVGAAVGDRVCYSVIRPGGRSKVTGAASRYEHPDGRIAYVKDKKIIGPVKKGIYVGTMTQELRPFDFTIERRPVKVTVRVHDLTLGPKGEFPLAVEGASDAWVKRGGAYQEEPFASSGVVPWSSGSVFGAAPPVGGPSAENERIELAADGTIARYDLLMVQDSYSLARSYVTVTNPARTESTCPTPYRCMYVRRVSPFPGLAYSSKWEVKTYPDRDTCSSECPRPFESDWTRPSGVERVECLPSVQACL